MMGGEIVLPVLCGVFLGASIGVATMNEWWYRYVRRSNNMWAALCKEQSATWSAFCGKLIADYYDEPLR